MPKGKHRKQRDRTHRRQLLRSAVLLATPALVVPLSATTAAPAPASARSAAEGDTAFVSRPEAAEAPGLTTTTTGQEDDGVLLTTPASGTSLLGAAIYDNSGELVWWKEGPYMNLEEVTYQGKPALSMFDNTNVGGRHVLLNSSYQEVGSYSMNGSFTDGHEFEVSPDGSRVLMLGFTYVNRDLSEYGGPADAQVIDAVIQEQDINTGEVLFEWSALDHIPLEETEESLTDEVVDYVHANSLTYDSDGNVLMSARHTSTVYKINASNGNLMWRLGGKNSTFDFPNAADRPSYQHDAQRLPDGRLLLFDNGNNSTPRQSRGAVYSIDETAGTAQLEEDLQPSVPLFALFAGSARKTDNGNTLLAFGNAGWMVEFSGTEQVFTADFADDAYTYRGVRSDWQGTPAAAPDVAWSKPDADGSRDFYMSWNGATEVDSWRIETGSSRKDLSEAETVDETGFETEAEVTVPDDAEVVQVSALDADGKVLDDRVLTEDTPTVSP